MTERTQPWEEPTAPLDAPTIRLGTSYRPGTAPVQRKPSEPLVEPTLVAPGWSDVVSGPRPPLRDRIRLLKRGREWSNLGALFAFVCWGIWAISERGTGLAVPLVAFVLVLLVAVGVFALSRLLGRVVLERTLHRRRHSAWPSHLVTGLFLAAAGVEYLRRTEWIVDALTWLRGLS